MNGEFLSFDSEGPSGQTIVCGIHSFKYFTKVKLSRFIDLKRSRIITARKRKHFEIVIKVDSELGCRVIELRFAQGRHF
jgi:hypothetical protein